MPKMPVKTKRKSVKDLPNQLKPYRWFGLDFDYKENAKEIITECPWCGKSKFSIKSATGLWQCWSCQEGSKKGGGNVHTFLNILLKYSLQHTTQSEYERLCSEKNLRDWESLKEWNACKSFINGEWLLPGYNGENKLGTLYRYMELEGKWAVLPAPELGTHLFGRHLFDPTKPITNVCEGFWDSVALYETLKFSRRLPSGKLDTTHTHSSSGNLLESHNVLGFPGTKVYFESWNHLFRDQSVNIFFDNDYPKESKSGVIVQAGFQGCKRLSSILYQIGNGPSEINYLKWGEEGYSQDYPNKFDVRDMLKCSTENKEAAKTIRLHKLKNLFNMLEPSPLEWADEAFEAHKESPAIPPIYCESYQDVIESWKSAFTMSREMDVALSVMYAVIASTLAVGDQLWLKVYGPPGSGKSTFCEALSLAKKYCLAKSSIRGFYSGFGTGETALVSEASGMTLITKEFDALANSPNLGQILSEARDIYDGAGRPSYRNQASKEYNGVRMTWIIAGTRSMRYMDKTELGARFLDCVMVENVSLQHEFDMALKASERAFKEVRQNVSDDIGTMYDPVLKVAMQLSAGYVEYLRKNASEMLANVEADSAVRHKCASYGLFTSFMRARPSETTEEDEDEKELGMRLTKQYSRLAACLTFVLNRQRVDDEVLRRTRKVCLDTSRGKVLRLTRKLFLTGGLSLNQCSEVLSLGTEETRRLLEYLQNVGGLEHVPRKLKSGGYSDTQYVWKLSNFLRNLYKTIVLSK